MQGIANIIFAGEFDFENWKSKQIEEVAVFKFSYKQYRTNRKFRTMWVFREIRFDFEFYWRFGKCGKSEE